MRGTLTGLTTTAIVAALVLLPAIPASALATEIALQNDDESATSVNAYPGDPDSESALVAAEERRLIEVRGVANAAELSEFPPVGPYRMVTGNIYTLVLPSRDAVYSLTDLIAMAPRSFVRQPDGAYLLSESIVIEEGATLDLSSTEDLTIRMLSSPQAFVSIVTIGGSLRIAGSAEDPTEVTSWNPDIGEVDIDTTDGRAYLRVVGGSADFNSVNFGDLGFWSGLTGGVSLTGTELAETSTTADGAEVPPVSTIDGIIPVDEGSEMLAITPDLSGYSYVSASINRTSFTGNAFGLFVTSAEGVDIRDSSFDANLVDGLVFHRRVTNSLVARSSASSNAGNGIAITRATTGVIIDQLTADENGENGIFVDGRSLAMGPSATGNPIGVYGNNTISNSSVTGNDRYGIEVVGGTNLTVEGNTVAGHEMGIVIRDGVESVAIVGNTVTDSAVQGIALRDSVLNATVARNSVDGGEIGIYLRESYGQVSDNTVSGVNSHAITLIGSAAATTIDGNSVTGSGPTAIDVARTTTAEVGINDADGWTSTKPLDVILRGIFQPLTVMWLILGLLVLITAVSGLFRKRTGIVNPYAHLAPLTSLTKGVITPEEAGIGVEHRVTQMPTKPRHFDDATMDRVP